jgi:hypothetical protein
MGLLNERDQKDTRRMKAAFDQDPAQLLVSLQELVDHNQTLPGIVNLFTTLVAESIDLDHPAHGYFVNRYEALRDQFNEVFRKAQAEGAVRADIPAETLVVMTFALMDGLQIQWLLDPQQVDMGEIFAAFVGMVGRGT